MEPVIWVVVALAVIFLATVVAVVRSRSGVAIAVQRAASESASAGARVEFERVRQAGLNERAMVASADRRYYAQNGIAAFVGVLLIIGIVAAIVVGVRSISADVSSTVQARHREETRRAISADRSYTLTELGYQATIREMSQQETIRSKAWAEAYAATGSSPYVPAEPMNRKQKVFMTILTVCCGVILGAAMIVSRRGRRG